MLFLTLYIATLSPGVNWGDSAKLATLSCQFYLHPNAGYHPLRTVLCYPFNWLPVADIAYRQNLSSAFYGALTLAVLFLLVRQSTSSIYAGLIAAISLGCSHTFWHLSVIAESYTIYTLFLTLAIWRWLRFAENGSPRELYLASFIAGIGLGGQLLLLFSILPLVCIVVIDATTGKSCLRYGNRPIIPGEMLKAAGAFLVGLSFLGLVAVYRACIEGWGVRETMVQILDLTHSHFIRPASSPGALARELFKRCLLFCYQFPLIGTVLFLGGCVSGFRRRQEAMLTLALIGLSNLLFTMVYVVPKWPYMMVGVYVIGAMVIGVGANAVERLIFLRPRRRYGIVVLCLAISPVTYITTATTLESRDTDIARHVPYRNNVRYFLVPWKRCENSASRFADEVIRSIPANGILISDFTASSVLTYYWTVQGDVPRFEVIDVDRAPQTIGEIIDAHWPHRPIYIVGGAPVYNWQELNDRYIVTRFGAIWGISGQRN